MKETYFQTIFKRQIHYNLGTISPMLPIFHFNLISLLALMVADEQQQLCWNPNY